MNTQISTLDFRPIAYEDPRAQLKTQEFKVISIAKSFFAFIKRTVFFTLKTILYPVHFIAPNYYGKIAKALSPSISLKPPVSTVTTTDNSQSPLTEEGKKTLQELGLPINQSQKTFAFPVFNSPSSKGIAPSNNKTVEITPSSSLETCNKYSLYTLILVTSLSILRLYSRSTHLNFPQTPTSSSLSDFSTITNTTAPLSQTEMLWDPISIQQIPTVNALNETLTDTSSIEVQSQIEEEISQPLNETTQSLNTPTQLPKTPLTSPESSSSWFPFSFWQSAVVSSIGLCAFNLYKVYHPTSITSIRQYRNAEEEFTKLAQKNNLNPEEIIDYIYRYLGVRFLKQNFFIQNFSRSDFEKITNVFKSATTLISSDAQSGEVKECSEFLRSDQSKEFVNMTLPLIQSQDWFNNHFTHAKYGQAIALVESFKALHE